MAEVHVCICGHCNGSHSNNGEGYCEEYLYGNFEMKCTCQCFSPYLTLTNERDIRDLTDAEQPFDESPETL